MRLPLAATLLLACALPGYAQQRPPAPRVDSAHVVELRMTDGTALLGRVVAVDDSSATLLTGAGLRIVVPRRSLRGWRPWAVGRFSYPDPNVSRLFFAPTGRTLAGGSGYFGDYFVIFPTVAYGVTDRITLAGGMSIIPGLDVDHQLFYVAPKVGVVRSRSLNVAVGALYLRWGWSNVIDAWGGIGYGVATIGGETTSLTVGLGWPFAAGTTSREPWVMFGAEQRLADDIKLMVEGWRFPGSDAVPAVVGLRFVGHKLSADFGVLRLYGAGYSGLAPWVDFVVNW